MRNFWRKYIPLTAKIPSWYPLSLVQKNELFQAQQKNIHFLHLPCNTLYTNRNYIIGCQCHFCKYEVSEEHRKKEQQNNIDSINYFGKTVPYTDSKWNSTIEYIYDHVTGRLTPGYPVFTPYYDLEETVKDTIDGEPIEFSPETKSLFPQ